MRGARISRILLVALLASTVVEVALAADIRGGAAPAAFRGVYAVTFTVKASSAPAPGAIILCKAKAEPNAPALENLRLSEVPETGSPVVITSSAMSGSWANCTVRIPFYWTAGNAQSGAVLSYEIDLVSGAGSEPEAAMTMRRQEKIAVAPPAPGGTASLSLHVSF